MKKKVRRRSSIVFADILGIKDLANKYPHEILGGQKQRTSAARALINKPSMVFADEPTGALDSKSASSLALERWRMSIKSVVSQL